MRPGPVCPLIICLLCTAVAGSAGAYYCLEDYKPVGTVVEKLPITSALNASANSTSGQVARQCAAACDAAADWCSGFRAIGPEVAAGGTCELLANSTSALPAALALGAKDPWPHVNANLSSADNVPLRSISYMCWRAQQDWDSFGQATHSVIVSGNVQGTGAAHPHNDWCAFGVDVAGTNLNHAMNNITAPVQCDEICRENVTGCTFWIFVASEPNHAQLQPTRNCFSKADVFRGQNGWTGKPKSDIWLADSQVTCFTSVQDWRHLGLVLSPSIKTIQLGGTFYSVYPERVMFSEAANTCRQLSGGKLAVLDSPGLLSEVSRQLLDTLPFQTAIRSAWVGVTGNNTAYNPKAAKNATNSSNPNAVVLQQPTQQPAVPVESTLYWVNGSRVAPGALRRPNTLLTMWTSHDVVWSQQFVPPGEKDVCGRVITQLPPDDNPGDPTSVLPGIWYFDCNKPGAFICQSTSPPTEPMSGREVTPDRVTATDTVDGAGGGGGAQQPWKTALAVILPVLAVALLAYQLLHVYSRKMSRLPELIRQQRKRALGQPRTGRMSLVMTDIQGFTGLMQEAPDHTTQALLLHNSVIKQAVYNNVGWVVEQEGDSFSVVFHEPEDAVAFTLQVQQALLQQSWPSDVTYHDDWEGVSSLLDCRPGKHGAGADTSTHGGTAAAAAALEALGSFTWQQEEDADPAAVGSPVPGTTAGQFRSSIDSGVLQGDPQRIDSTVSQGSNHSSSSKSLAAVRAGRAELVDGPTSPGMSPNTATRMFRGQGIFRQNSASSDEMKNHWQLWGRSSSPSMLAPAPSCVSAGPQYNSSGSRKSVLGGRPRNLWLFNQLLGSRPEQQKLFSGLRVRMGIVTGEVERGQELKSSDLYRAAQDVSDAAHGGQVLLDEHTFLAVKEAMWRLGAVGPNGLNYDALNATKSARHGTAHTVGWGGAVGLCGDDGCLPRLGSATGSRREVSTISSSSQLSPTPNSSLAIALDMGCYEVLSPADPAYPHITTNSSSSSSSGNADGTGSKTHTVTGCVQLWTKDLGDKLVQQYQLYIQQQLTRQASLGTEEGLELENSFDEEAPYMTRARRAAQQQHHLKQQLQSSSQHQHHQLQQQHSLGLRQLSIAGRSSGQKPGGGGAVGGPGTLGHSSSSRQQQQQQQHGLAGRSMSMTIPYSWQQVTSTLFGLGSIQPTPSGPTGSVVGRTDSLLRDRSTQLLGFCSISAVLRKNIRLYQVVAAPLAGRAVLFGQQLDLPQNWRVLDPAFFDAPGLSSAFVAAQLYPDTPTAAAGAAGGRESGGLGEMLRQRLPGSDRRLSLQQQQRVPGRTASEVYPLAQQQQQGLQGIRAVSVPEASLRAVMQQQQGQGQQTGTSASAAPAHTGTSAEALPAVVLGDAVAAGNKPGAVGGDAGASGAAHQPPTLGNLEAVAPETPFMSAAQHRLSSSEVLSSTGEPPSADAVAATTAAAEQPQYNGPVLAATRQNSGGVFSSGGVHSSSTGLLQPYSSSGMAGHQAASPHSTTGFLQQPAAAAAALDVTQQQQTLMLRAASLQLNMGASSLPVVGPYDRRAGGASRLRLSGPTRALFPPVTILFAAVEGAGELLRYPAMARSVHLMLHHLMLQLLRSFPGSYLVRAQQGDLKFMLAFTSPAAAVAWGITLQEASLYLPYPQEVLGLSSFGVQLDEGGRLVFRGPRFKMGLSEGTPKVILPDHLGRADYHGSFVNLAARYAVVAAQGGQLVTDADLARQVLWHWKSSSPSSNVINVTNPQGSSKGGSMGIHSSSGHPPLPPVQHQLVSTAAGTSDISVIRDSSSSLHAAAAGPSPAAIAAESAPVGSSGGDVVVLQPSNADGATAATAAATALVPVECCWLGSFLFKGNPSPASMVTFGASVLSGRHFAAQTVSSSKGVRVLQRVGVMDRAVVELPAAVEGFGPWEDVAGGRR